MDFVEPPQSEEIKTNNTMKYKRKYINAGEQQNIAVNNYICD